MSENFNRLLTKKIINNIPDNKKPVNYLMDILNIGRESSYRRMRGNIPYTFEEVAKISQNLSFSIDDIIDGSTRSNNSFYGSNHKKSTDFDDVFYANHLNYYKLLEKISKAKETDIFFSVNNLSSYLVYDFDVLFKFYYYICMHQYCGISVNQSFSEIALPDNLVSLRQKIKSASAAISTRTYIFDQHVIKRLVRKLQYYYGRNLISSDELEMIKNDAIHFLDHVEKFFQIGANGSGIKHDFYLSLLDVDMNSLYGVYDNSIVSQYWIYNFYPMIIENKELISMHKNWINTLKRSSVLISQSNEIVQALHLNLQHENIGKVTNDIFYNYG